MMRSIHGWQNATTLDPSHQNCSELHWSEIDLLSYLQSQMNKFFTLYNKQTLHYIYKESLSRRLPTA